MKDRAIMEIAGASPTSFFHENADYDETKQTYTVNLENKILIFIDQPQFQLLQRLRPLLSHDRKTLTYKITDKKASGANRTKTVIIKGFCTIIFCTGGLATDEQEKTRLILLSPSTSEQKIGDALELIAKCDSQRKNGKPTWRQTLIDNSLNREYRQSENQASQMFT